MALGIHNKVTCSIFFYSTMSSRRKFLLSTLKNKYIFCILHFIHILSNAQQIHFIKTTKIFSVWKLLRLQKSAILRGGRGTLHVFIKVFSFVYNFTRICVAYSLENTAHWEISPM
jgi:hypothetical protein